MREGMRAVRLLPEAMLAKAVRRVPEAKAKGPEAAGLQPPVTLRGDPTTIHVSKLCVFPQVFC